MERVEVINNPIDVKRAQRLSEEKSDHYFDEQKINLLTVAQLREEKRHDLMLETLALLPTEYYLTIVGSGEKEESLKTLSTKLGIAERVSFEGQQSNPYVYMKNADLFLLTSEREGFPNVLLEANAIGLPLVAFACLGGIKEIISEGENGYFVPFGETELLAKQIEALKNISFNKDAIMEQTAKKYAQSSIMGKYKKAFGLKSS